MKRKLLTMLLAATMAAGCLPAYAVQAEDEIVDIYWQYPSYGEISEGFQDMEDALNEMLEKDLGVHVTFVTTGLMESQNDAILMVSAGEQLDVCLSFLTGIGNVVDKGLVLELDELLDKTNTLETFRAHNTDPYTSSGYQGHAYGVGCGETQVQTKSYLMKKSFADKYGFVPDENKIYTLDEIEEMFATVKEGEGDNFICFVPWNNTYEPLNYCLAPYDALGGGLAHGVIMLNNGYEDTTIKDLFETEEYASFCDRMYDWAQKGYIAADAAITADTPDDIVNRENVLGTFGYGAQTAEMIENSWQEPVVQFKVTDYYIPSTLTGAIWSIPVTSGNPEKALETIAYVYDNPEAAWLIQYGIQGESWEITERDGDAVKGRYLSDDLSTLPYLNPYGLWADRLLMPAFGDADIHLNEMKKEWNDRAKEEGKITPAAGYVFDASSVSAEIAAVQTVIAQYATSLNCGALDPSQALPEFIDALKGAGMDTIIAENQAQLDAWLAAK